MSSEAPRLLIANRGEIARRILRSARARGYAVAVVSTSADRGAPVRAEADEVFEVPDFLDATAVIGAAERFRADLLHPGYGFLSESPSFAAAVEAAGIGFVGPTAEAMRRLGDKESARRTAIAVGVPVLPSLSSEELAATGDPVREAERAGLDFPCAVKAAAGGGGIGIRVVRRPEDLAGGLASASAEARAAFGDGRVFVERWLDRPRHVEIQVFGDGRGGGIHLGERECSVQRRRQKLVEWSPGFGISEDLRARMGEAALRLVVESRYRGAGTVEFLLDRDGAFFFLEVNTRLQVEHPVTEEVYGVDLVDAQLSLAAGGWPDSLPRPVSRPEAFRPLAPRRAAMEVRVLAESPRNGFAPSPGRLRRYYEPEGDDVRVDSGVVEGTPVPPGFDSLLAKVIARGETLAAAASRLAAALEDTVIHGVETNVSLLISVLRDPEFLAGNAHAGWVEERVEELAASRLPGPLQEFLRRERVAEALSAAALRPQRAAPADIFRSLGSEGGFPRVDPGSRPGEVLLSGGAVRDAGVTEPLRATATPLPGGREVAVTVAGETLILELSGGGEKAGVASQEGEVRAPLAGVVVSVVDSGSSVAEGEVVAVIESMKMHWEIRAPVGGAVADATAGVGDAVTAGAVLLRVVAPTPGKSCG